MSDATDRVISENTRELLFRVSERLTNGRLYDAVKELWLLVDQAIEERRHPQN
jgi:hypothetical protein